ncbi:MAG TPA: WYL domain-containing protein [Labilithrix sp.]|nr:WYL domain-containing protein [Labilithrix sp.]
MGQRSSTVTVVQLVQAFLEQRTWTQKALADRLEMTTPAVREKLRELEGIFNLEREEEHPHVYWSVPKDWFPGGILFTREQMPELLRLLMRLPQGKARDGLLDTVLRNLPKGDARAISDGLPTAVVPPTSTKQEEQYLSVVEDAAAKKVSLGFHYFTASRGQMSTRHASVQRVMLGRPARFVATCHRDDKLKWFRVENIVSAHLDSQVPFRPADPKAVEQFLRASVDGFNAGGAAAELSFVVRDPESRWVQNNLLPSMKVEGLSNNRIRVSVETNAILQVARYVVGLGAAASAETPALAAAVEVLARGALGERAELATNR